MRLLGSHRSGRRFLGRALLVVLIPVLAYIAFDVLDIDGSGFGNIVGTVALLSDTDQDLDLDRLAGSLPFEASAALALIPSASAVVQPLGHYLSSRALRAIRAGRLLARGDMSGRATHSESRTDPA